MKPLLCLTVVGTAAALISISGCEKQQQEPASIHDHQAQENWRVVDRDVVYLGEFRFPVLKGKPTLHALMSNATDFRLYWMLNIPCEGADVVIDGETHHWQPRVYLESMTYSCRNWRELVGQHYLSTARDNDPPAIYLNEHESLDKSDIHFVARQGVLYDIDWKFVWSDKKGRVRTNVTFTDVTVWLDEVKDEAMAMRRLEKDLDLSLFSKPEIVLHPSAGPRFKFKPIP
jgi:hypothetical protein